MQQKPVSTRVQIHDLIRSRWSPRAFDPARQVSRDHLLALLEAARWAPSAFNDQPWRFIVCDKAKDESGWQKALATLVEKNRLWARNAPLLILAVAMDEFDHNGQPNRSAMYDTGAASVSLALQATALGLATHQMGGFDSGKAREVFKLPDNCKPMAMIAVGYQAPVGVLSEDFKAAELASRERAPLPERFYSGQWAKGIE